jgi:hypothetical protein
MGFPADCNAPPGREECRQRSVSRAAENLNSGPDKVP